MAAGRTKIPVVSGRQAWRLLRTDRDGASAEEIPQMAAAFLHFVLGGEKHEIVSTGENTWRFGAVRPLRVLHVSQSSPGRIQGKTLADRQTSVPGTIPTVVGERPWFIIVEFWWRKPPTEIDYPGMRVSFLGTRHYQLDGADWVLDHAAQLDDTDDPGDQTWESEQGDRIEEALRKAAEARLDSLIKGSMGALALLALFFFFKKD